MIDDPVTRLEYLIRTDLLAEMGGDPSGELGSMSFASLLIIYANWRQRFISQHPREAHLSIGLSSSPNYEPHADAVAAIVTAIEAGTDLTPHLSRGIRNSYTPIADRSSQNNRRRDLDLLISEWGIHHLHLSTSMEADGFVTRSEDLLFAKFRPDDAYIIGVFPHGSWTNMDLVATCVSNWPEANLFHEIKGGLSLSSPFNQADLDGLRSGGVATMLDIDGRLYAPEGQTTAGTSMKATSAVNNFMSSLARLRGALAGESNELTTQFAEQGLVVSAAQEWKAVREGSVYGLRDSESQMFIRVTDLPW